MTSMIVICPYLRPRYLIFVDSLIAMWKIINTAIVKIILRNVNKLWTEIKRWNKAGGKVLPGLTKRREKEYRMCMGEI